MSSKYKEQIEQLIELKKLYESGVISMDEVQSRKKVILGLPSQSSDTNTYNKETDYTIFEDEETFYLKYKEYIWGATIIILLILGIVCFTKTNSNKTDELPIDTDSITIVKEEVVSAPKDDNLQKAILDIKNQGTVITTVDKKIYYLKNEQTNTFDSEGENCGKIYVYNSTDGSTSIIPIRIPSGEPYSINSWNYNDGKITFVLYDVARNGFGVGNYCTEVSQYNIKTGQWKDVAEGCAKAKQNLLIIIEKSKLRRQH